MISYTERQKKLLSAKDMVSITNSPKLGRPLKDKEKYQAQTEAEYKESGERHIVEGKFGEGKRKYGMNCIMTKLKETSETQIHQIQMIVFTIDVARALRRALKLLFFAFLEAISACSNPN